MSYHLNWNSPFHAIVVKVTDIDQQGRINLSRRDAILALEAKRAAQEQQ